MSEIQYDVNRIENQKFFFLYFFISNRLIGTSINNECDVIYFVGIMENFLWMEHISL